MANSATGGLAQTPFPPIPRLASPLHFNL